MALKLQPPDSVAQLCSDDLSKLPNNIVVGNSGLRGPFACKFPFSERLLSFFTDNLRRQLEHTFGLDIDKLNHSLTALIDSTLGQELVAVVLNRLFVRDPTAYLYDFVASVIYPMQYISFATQFAYIKAVMDATNSQKSTQHGYVPGIIHAKYWYIERSMRLFTMFSTLSIIKSGQHLYNHDLFIPLDIEDTIVSSVQSLCGNFSNILDDTSTIEKSINKIDCVVVSNILSVIKISLESIYQQCTANQSENESFYILIQKWAQLFSLVQNSLETLVSLAIDRKAQPDHMIVDSDSHLAIKMSADAYSILKLFWFLTAARVLVTEYLNLCRTSSLDISVFGALLAALEIEADPTSTSSLQGFMVAASKYPMMYPVLIKSYLKKFLIPQFEVLKRVNYDEVISYELLYLVGTLALGYNISSITFSSEIEKADFVQIETALHRSAIDVLYMTAKQGTNGYNNVDEIFKELILKDPTAFIHVSQLYLERAENDDASLISAELSHIQQNVAIPADAIIKSPLLLNSAASNDVIYKIILKEGISLLVEIAQVKLLIARYTKVVYEHLVGTNETSDVNFPPISAIFRAYLQSVLEAQIYKFNHIIHRGGKSLVLAYLRRRDPPVMLPGMTSINQDSPMIKSIDPFSSLAGREIYMEACAVAVQIRQKKNIDALKKWSKDTSKKIKKWNEKVNIFIAAVYTQITSNLSAIQADVADRVIEWMNQDFYESSHTAGIELSLYIDFIRFLLTSTSAQKQSGHDDGVTATNIEAAHHYYCFVA
ncbi:unnamed protein product [Sphagnum jensenii]|uniref:Uncharacterized protein n=1 Tax=Sphagnum jensenii TaxID=128206 RepID=A0ABP0VB38_9BRYO